MKRRGIICIALLLMAVLSLSLAGCSSNSASNTTSSTASTSNAAKNDPLANAPKIEGTTFDDPKFSITVPKGWQTMKIDSGIQMYLGMDTVQVFVRGSNLSDTEDKRQIESMAKDYQGTPAEQIDIFGKKFWKTTYTQASLSQTTYLSVANGQLVSVQVGGKDHDKNDTLKGILATLKFK